MTKLIETCQRNKFQATNIQTCVGSVKYCWLKTPGSSQLTLFNQGTYEIVSLVGNIDRNQNPNIHISLADKYGSVIGGRLPSLQERQAIGSELFDCPIFTTAEIILTETIELSFSRENDPQTSQQFLKIFKRSAVQKKDYIIKYLGKDEL